MSATSPNPWDLVNKVVGSCLPKSDLPPAKPAPKPAPSKPRPKPGK